MLEGNWCSGGVLRRTIIGGGNQSWPSRGMVDMEGVHSKGLVMEGVFFCGKSELDRFCYGLHMVHWQL